MPLLEATQTRRLSASIRLTDTTAVQVNQNAAFIHSSADEVLKQALAYFFAKDRGFQKLLKSAEAQKITPTLRVLRVADSEAPEQPPRNPASGAANGSTFMTSMGDR